MRGPVLEVHGLRKSYGHRVVLRGVDLIVEPGQIVGIVGENGSGKTTLLRVLAGLLRADAGTLKLRGTVGYCPQEPLVFGALTVAENFRFFGTAYSLRGWEKTRDLMLNRLRFGSWLNTRVDQVSGGTKQKLNLALSLLHGPSTLILDEPYAGFDWETYLHFWELAVDWRTEGRSALIVSHLIHDRSYLDKVHHLSGGVLQCD